MRMMTRIAAAAVLMVVGGLPAFAQGTLAPVAKQTFTDANNNAVANGRLYVYAAGTTTPATIYSNATLTTPALNAAVCSCSNLDASGRFTFFLSASSYRFTLKTSSDVLVWDVDNVSSVPPSSVNLDVDGTAGEAVTAGDVVYLSAGDGAKTAGYWYKASTANTYASTDATVIGMVPSSIAATATGSIRLSGRITTGSGVTAGLDYYVSTGGALTSTLPANRRLVGRADTSTTLVIEKGLKLPELTAGVALNVDVVCGRLTLTSGTPVTTTDVPAATTLYYALDGCDRIALYDGSVAWTIRAFTELSIAIPATTSQLYDVFIYDNSGTPALELLAWTNDTTRATALVRQNGRWVKTGATTRRYVGSVRTTTVSGQTEDSAAKRYVWNYYNRVRAPVLKFDSTDSWSYTSTTIRQANGAAANQVDIVVGLAETTLDLSLMGITSGATGNVSVGIGEDSTSTYTAGAQLYSLRGGDGQFMTFMHRLVKMPAIGRHFYAWNESGNTSATFYGDNAGSAVQAGLLGTWEK